jgi:hypothetical protein
LHCPVAPLASALADFVVVVVAPEVVVVALFLPPDIPPKADGALAGLLLAGAGVAAAVVAGHFV